MKTSVMLACAALSILSGCARTYYNPYITDEAALKRQFAIDDGYCVRASAGSVTVPQIRTYEPDRQSYTIIGTGSSYNSSTGFTNYNYSGQAYSSGGGSFSSGFANGFNMASAIGAKKEKDRIYHGCMMSLGWTTDKNAIHSSAKDDQWQIQEEVDLNKIQDAIDSIPELAAWQTENGDEWELAVMIDERLRQKPEYQNIEYRDRFLEVVKRVKRFLENETK